MIQQQKLRKLKHSKQAPKTNEKKSNTESQKLAQLLSVIIKTHHPFLSEGFNLFHTFSPSLLPLASLPCHTSSSEQTIRGETWNLKLRVNYILDFISLFERKGKKKDLFLKPALSKGNRV